MSAITRGATFFVLLARAATCSAADSIAYEVVAQHPHDASAFTQGLAIERGVIYESSGRYGVSALTRTRLKDGRELQRVPLAAEFFAEGLAIARGAVVQLTWREGRALTYDARTLAPRAPFSYAGEGWGLAWDGERFLMSDGSARITLRDASTFDAVGAVTVRDGERPVAHLNELEYARGWLYANVWQTDRVAVIEPATGAVRGWLDLAPLRARFTPPPGWSPGEHVPNGIAFDPGRGHFFVTGKCWPALFELKVKTLRPPASPRPSN